MIIWLASYPKSGNTWCRAFLTAYLTGKTDLSNMEGAPIAGARKMLDRQLGFPTVGLPHAEVEAWRPDAYLNLAEACRRSGRPAMIKVHDMWKMTPAGEPLFPIAATGRAVYIVRDPRDVACSFAHHLGKPVEQLVGNLNQPGFALAVNGESSKQQVMQTLGTWSEHFCSWIDYSGLYCYLIRYEDLKANEFKVWRGLIDYLGLEFDPDRLQQAVMGTQFAELQAKEKAKGFREASKVADAPFFRKGKAGGWKDELNASQVSRIELQHMVVMKRLGYL